MTAHVLDADRQRAPMSSPEERDKWEADGAARAARIDPLLEAVVERVEARRLELGMSWTELGSRCGGHPLSAFHWKKRQQMSLRSVALAADVLRTTTDYLLTGREPKERA